ncbi:Sperm-associated antigen 1A [Linum perenne]
MNSNYGKGSSNGSTNTFNFDLGLGSNRSKPLNDLRNQNSSGYSSFSYSSSTTSTAQPRPAFQPGKPSWTHQPAAASQQPARSGLLDGPNSMVGDIFGKTWSSTGPAKGSGIGIGAAEKNPNLFGDLVSSALGQGSKGSTAAPLKNATPAPSKSSYSMGNVADSLPKVSNPAQGGAGWGSNGSFGGSYNRNANNATASNAGINANKSSSIGGTTMKGMASSGGMMSGNKDPFVSLVDFSSKPQSGNLNSGPKGKTVNAGASDAFGDFQTASKSSSTSVPSNGFGANSGDFFGSSTGTSSNMADFGMPSNGFGSQKQSSAPSNDPLGMFFNSSSGSAAPAKGGAAGQQFSELDDWGADSGFGGGAEDAGGSTTELEGLPPPPAGVSASSAKSKGVDHQKQGQYADAIKWLSWAVVLLEKTNDKALTVEVLSTRASCYKEVGEYKKAVADCSKVLEGDEVNVSVLVQRALLYESMEKYKLGAEDLRAVLKIDPMNRIARSTVHRLTKMAE